MTNDWVDVAPAQDFSPGQYRVVTTDDDVVIAVFNVDGQYYAVENICTHDGETLTGGPFTGDEITCPRHGARFCVRTGEVLSPPAYEPLTPFPIRISDGMVQVRDDRWD